MTAWVRAMVAGPARGVLALVLAAAAPAPPVLVGPVPRAPAAAPPTYAQVLDPLLERRGAGTMRAAVVDLTTGDVVYARAADQPAIPASTTKIVTAVAALEALGPDRRFSTTVVAGRSTSELVLVGGGDPLLSATSGDLDSGVTRTPLARLAERTVAAVRARPAAARPRAVVVRADDTLFARPAPVPSWEARYVRAGVVGLPGALSLDGGRRSPRTSVRVADPAAAAAARLAALLTAAGLPATARGRLTAPAGAAVLAEVQSVPASQAVEHMLSESDNDVAEVLARHAAVARGLRADAAGAAQALSTTLRTLGVDLRGAVVLDGSGLSRDDRLSAAQLTAVLAVAAAPDRSDLSTALSGLAVAGLTGTLAARYARPSSVAGRGIVRAKTGGLTGVTSLAGTTVGADGRTYLFAFVGNDLTGSGPARRAVDDAAAALTACGCRPAGAPR